MTTGSVLSHRTRYEYGHIRSCVLGLMMELTLGAEEEIYRISITLHRHPIRFDSFVSRLTWFRILPYKPTCHVVVFMSLVLSSHRHGGSVLGPQAVVGLTRKLMSSRFLGLLEVFVCFR